MNYDRSLKMLKIFQNVCINILHKYAPEKRKYVRANQANSMDTEVNHAIMVRSKLRLLNYLKSR